MESANLLIVRAQWSRHCTHTGLSHNAEMVQIASLKQMEILDLFMTKILPHNAEMESTAKCIKKGNANSITQQLSWERHNRTNLNYHANMDLIAGTKNKERAHSLIPTRTQCPHQLRLFKIKNCTWETWWKCTVNLAPLLMPTNSRWCRELKRAFWHQ